MNDNKINNKHPAVMIIDDNPDNLNLLSAILKECGYHIRPAPSGKRALEAVKSEPPDIILLDVMMPDMDGFEVCRTLKSGRKTKDIPIIFLTALDNWQDEGRGLMLGAVDYITKPFNNEIVKARVNTQLQLKFNKERLEQVVSERTAELIQANKDLLSEIDERKKAEDELKFSNIILKTQQEASIDGILIVDEEGKIISMNRRFITMWGISQDIVESKSDEKALNSILNKLTDPEKFLDKVRFLYGHHNEISRDIIVLTDGLNFDRYSAPMIGPGGTYFGRVWYFRDITEHITDLKEKEALIKELYHRTYNNMQVISSMLSAQTSYVKDEKVKAVFHEMSDRITSMAKVHQKLYQSNNLSSINLQEYIVELSDLLKRSYYGLSDKISFILDLEDEEVLIDTAIPCGLIINELITNALKYAFPNGRMGSIKISLHRIDKENLELQVSDNGVSVSKDFDLKSNRGMGLQIIHDIAEKQLEGKVTFEPENGLKAVIRFKDKLYHKRI
jgi:two-component sensor histidine kinase/ActR/RegA family two-component response regulator